MALAVQLPAVLHVSAGWGRGSGARGGGGDGTWGVRDLGGAGPVGRAGRAAAGIRPGRERRVPPRSRPVPASARPLSGAPQAAAQRGDAAEAALGLVRAGARLQPPAPAARHDGAGGPGQPALR